MKILPIILLVSFLSLVSCERGKSTSDNAVDHLAQYRDTIVGNFSGSKIDTLICEPLDSITDPTYQGFHYHWRVYAKNGSVDDVLIDNTIRINFVKEGYLDGVGGAEWGYKTV